VCHRLAGQYPLQRDGSRIWILRICRFFSTNCVMLCCGIYFLVPGPLFSKCLLPIYLVWEMIIFVKCVSFFNHNLIFDFAKFLYHKSKLVHLYGVNILSKWRYFCFYRPSILNHVIKTGLYTLLILERRQGKAPYNWRS
jgi:hypothetical protein